MSHAHEPSEDSPRLDRITTGVGDKGDTVLGDGSRVRKDHARVEALGTVDELNSCIGVVLSHEVPGDVREALSATQHELFEFGAELAVPGYDGLSQAAVERVNDLVPRFTGALPPLKEFILPGGVLAAAACHVARTVCRRAERRVIALSEIEDIRPELIVYLNRLSDVLFCVARLIQRASGQPETQWKKPT